MKYQRSPGGQRRVTGWGAGGVFQVPWWRHRLAMAYSGSEDDASEAERGLSGSSDEYSGDEGQRVSQSVFATKAFAWKCLWHLLICTSNTCLLHLVPYTSIS